jgi:hypothetical protein
LRIADLTASGRQAPQILQGGAAADTGFSADRLTDMAKREESSAAGMAHWGAFGSALDPASIRSFRPAGSLGIY